MSVSRELGVRSGSRVLEVEPPEPDATGAATSTMGESDPNVAVTLAEMGASVTAGVGLSKGKGEGVARGDADRAGVGEGLTRGDADIGGVGEGVRGEGVGDGVVATPKPHM